VQVRAFEPGADDYVTKPFRPRELMARLLANLRRGEPEARSQAWNCTVEIDLAARVVRRDGEEVHLTPIEFKLLGALIQDRWRLLTHNALLQHVWGPAYTDAARACREPATQGRPRRCRALIHTDHGSATARTTCIPSAQGGDGLRKK
jgi:two-component system KDP operon response regulator KdpE